MIKTSHYLKRLAESMRVVNLSFLKLNASPTAESTNGSRMRGMRLGDQH